jgi:hypothetical protein
MHWRIIVMAQYGLILVHLLLLVNEIFHALARDNNGKIREKAQTITQALRVLLIVMAGVVSRSSTQAAVALTLVLTMYNWIGAFAAKKIVAFVLKQTQG